MTILRGFNSSVRTRFPVSIENIGYVHFDLDNVLVSPGVKMHP
jgi:hypothetical protein